MSDYCSNVVGEKHTWGVCKEVPLVSIILWQMVPSLRCVVFFLWQDADCKQLTFTTH